MKLRTMALWSTAIVTLAASLAPELALAQSNEDGGATLGEVVVTARRVEENLQTTPVAVTAIGEAALQQAQVTQAVDLQRTAPSLAIGIGAPASSGFVFISMRGQGNLNPTVSNDPAVATYIDGVYIARPSQGAVDLNDMQRVEVLRGPQGTLFGRNTIGGALNIVTNDPRGVFEGSVKAELGNYDYRNAGFVLNVPLMDKLAARVTYQHSEHDGYVDDPVLNRSLSDRKSDFVRGKLRYEGDKFDVTLSGDYNKIIDHGQATRLAGYNSAILGAVLTPAQVATLNASLITKDNWWTTFATGFSIPTNPLYATLPAGAQALAARPVGNKLEAYGGSATINFDLGFANLKSISAYRYSLNDGVIDTDGTPLTIITTQAAWLSKAYSQELQLSGALTDRFDYILGAYYSKENGTEGSRSQALGFFPVTPAAPFRGLPTENFADVENITTGLFAQGYYKITDTVRMTGGLRWTWDKRNVVLHNKNVFGLPATCNVPVPDAPGTCNQSLGVKFDYPAWTVGLDWQASDNVFAYVKSSGAAKAGGWNTRASGPVSPPAFSPEKTKDIELGVKADLLDRRLRTNIALFHSWQTDTQRNASALTAAGNPTQFLVNAGSAKVKGVELEVTALPWTGMEVTATGALMDGHYKDGTFNELQVVPGVGFVGCTVRPPPNTTTSSCLVNRSGEPLPQLPKKQFNIGATQTFPTGLGELVIHADYSYVSAQHYFTATAATQAPQATKNAVAVQNGLGRTGGYGVLNGRVALRLEQPNLEVYAFGRNLLKEKYTTRALSDLYNALGFASTFVGDPRTYGVGVMWRFGG